MTDHVKAIVDGVRPMIEVVDAKAKALEARIDDLSAQVRERASASSLPGVEPKKSIAGFILRGQACAQRLSAPC